MAREAGGPAAKRMRWIRWTRAAIQTRREAGGGSGWSRTNWRLRQLLRLCAPRLRLERRQSSGRRSSLWTEKTAWARQTEARLKCCPASACTASINAGCACFRDCFLVCSVRGELHLFPPEPARTRLALAPRRRLSLTRSGGPRHGPLSRPCFCCSRSLRRVAEYSLCLCLRCADAARATDAMASTMLGQQLTIRPAGARAQRRQFSVMANQSGPKKASAPQQETGDGSKIATVAVALFSAALQLPSERCARGLSGARRPRSAACRRPATRARQAGGTLARPAAIIGRRRSPPDATLAPACSLARTARSAPGGSLWRL